MGNTKYLSSKMKEEAIGLGLCKQWTKEWKDNTSKDGMVQKFVRGIDFCIEHDWPSVQVIKRDFGDVIHNHGVYADESVNISNAPFVVLNGECDAELKYSWTSAGDIYVRHKSKAKICAKDVARVFVSVYDDSSVDIECEEGAKCFVYLYGGSVKSKVGDVILRDKRKGAEYEEK